MTRHFLAACLYAWAAGAWVASIALAVLAVRHRRAAAAPAVLAFAFAGAVLLNAGLDLW